MMMTEASGVTGERWIAELDPQPRCRILVADDSEEVLQFLTDYLARCGHAVATATDGIEALAVAEQTRPHLVLLDLRLPRLCGWEVARRLRARFGGSIFLAALTGWSAPRDRERSMAAGFDRHLTKPATLIELRALAREALERS
jgi:CheY-like chemotaxis protein